MLLLDERLVLTPTDVTVGAQCEFAMLRLVDAKLGRAPTGGAEPDAMLRRIADLGDAHERRVLAAFEERVGADQVAHIPLPGRYTVPELMLQHQRTIEAVHGGAAVIYQGGFYDGSLHGRADFLVRTSGPSEPPVFAVHDAKLARRAKVPALLQIAAYADQLQRAALGTAPDAYLELGDGHVEQYRIGDLLPAYRERLTKLRTMLERHMADGRPVVWRDTLYMACGRCETCAAEVAAHRDVLLVANLRTSQRARLAKAGIVTVEDLARSSGPVSGISSATLNNLRAQARLQSAQDAAGTNPDGRPAVRYDVISSNALRALPPSDPGDIYFDFEGDPLWSEPGSSDWGLEYLFGVMEADGTFRPFWAHERAEEKRALADFLDYVVERRATYPGMHIYHYAPYEKTALGRLTGRHDHGGDVLDDLLRDGVLVDLYATVRQAIRVSQPSYSIKKLEPLYMGDRLRTELDNAADSIVEYAEAVKAREAGDDETFQRRLESIREYNEYDCLSTLELCMWLRSLAPASAPATDEPHHDGGANLPAALPDDQAASDDHAALRAALLTRAGAVPREDRTNEQQAYALVAAGLGYHRREDMPFWWAHFERLRSPFDEWSDARDTVVPERVSVDRDWATTTGRQKRPRRVLRFLGTFPPGSTIRPGSTVNLQYEGAFPGNIEPPRGGVRATHDAATILSIEDSHDEPAVLVEEHLKTDFDEHHLLPVALTPGAPPSAKPLAAALTEVADQVEVRGLFQHPALDILRRVPPRLVGGAALPAVPEAEAGYIEAITCAVRDLDNSYVAVQGPPGTGKTYVGARVIRRLVESGWRVGVVAQSHAVVENVLDRVVEAGLPPERVGKVYKGEKPCGWTKLKDNGHARFLAQHAGPGCVIGGTAWDFVNTKRVGRAELDLLVIDEAGQFSLANTLAVSVAARRLLLLGDPQQLPQVSQGTHPEPVDQSALAWIADGADTLPEHLGYFLHTTWRMHPELCRAVSGLSYEGKLVSKAEVTAERHLDALPAGVQTVVVPHTGNVTVSVEEAAEVVNQVRRLLGSAWRDGAATRTFGPADVIVVAAYNAQVAAIRARLLEAGITGVRVGTVDKFQGQEAPVVIVSMAASAVEDVPRGMGFLLSRNRVNVAVSRGQWAAIVVRSERLTDFLPTTPSNLLELGAFIGLCSGSVGGDPLRTSDTTPTVHRPASPLC